MTKRKKLIIAVVTAVGVAVLVIALVTTFKNLNGKLQNKERIFRDFQLNPQQTEELDIVVNIHDVTTVYGEPITTDFDFDFQILNKELKITKEELKKQLFFVKEPGQDVGIYTIRLETSNSELIIGYTEGVYKITKARYDMSNVYFEDMVIEFDGVYHELIVTGSIPEGVQVRYKNNIATEVGEYLAVAYFIGDNKNYYPIEDMRATLRILSSKGNSTANIKETETVTETTVPIIQSQTQTSEEKDEKVKQAKILVKIHNEKTTYGDPLVKKFDFDFEIIEGNIEITKDELRKQILFTKQPGKDVGVYLINGTSRVFNSNVTLEFIPGKYHIVKARYDTSKLWFKDKTVTYDGKEHQLTVSGVLPDGVTVYYDNNKHSKVGKYKVTVHFNCDTRNYYKISDMYATLTIIPPADEGNPVTSVSGTGGNTPKPPQKPDETSKPDETEKPTDTTPTETSKPDETEKPTDTTPTETSKPDEEEPPIDVSPDQDTGDEEINPQPPIEVPDETVTDVPPGPNIDDEEVIPDYPIEVPDEPAIDIPPGLDMGDEEPTIPNFPVEVPDF